MRRSSLAPMFAAALLLLPMTYLGAYAALVMPQGREVVLRDRCGPITHYEYYRCDPRYVERIFWPLEKTDRMLRPAAWRN